MSDYFLKSVKNKTIFPHNKDSKKMVEGEKVTKKYNIIIITILVLVTGLFFSIFSGDKILAQEDISDKKIELEDIDPLEKIGKGIISENEIDSKEYSSIFNDSILEKDLVNPIYSELVKDYPIEAMISEISKCEKSVAAFLLSIAKKESNWGLHSPKKNGKDCYNYWGYKGRYNPTDSGYSCFDSPEHAVAVVGGRIENLVNQNIDTPEKMVIWKCGSDCSWDNPVAVRKWISDVRLYYNKLNS